MSLQGGGYGSMDTLTCERPLSWDSRPDVSSALRALEDEGFSDRFRSWRGASGRTYIFSVFDSTSCPAYCQAVIIAAYVDTSRRRIALGFADTGSFPEPKLAQLRRAHQTDERRLEFHVHLLASTAEERRAVMGDIEAA